MDTPRSGFLPLARTTFRGVLDGGCPLWNEPRVFSQWEALMDLRQLAAWAPHERIIRGAPVPLSRGELVISVRQAATRWQWSTGRIQRFLRMLVENGFLARRTRTGDGDIYHIETQETSGWRRNGAADGGEDTGGDGREDGGEDKSEDGGKDRREDTGEDGCEHSREDTGEHASGHGRPDGCEHTGEDAGDTAASTSANTPTSRAVRTAARIPARTREKKREEGEEHPRQPPRAREEREGEEGVDPLSGSGEDREFDTWFAVYPAHRREARLRAFRAWQATTGRRPGLAAMLAALEAQRRSRRWSTEGGRYVPAAWNYLEQGRWGDDLAAYSSGDAGADTAAFQFDLAARLGRLAAALPAMLAERERWASRIAAIAGGPAEVEEQLEALDLELMNAAWAGLGEEQQGLVGAAVELAAAAVAGRLPPDRLAACREQLRHQEVRRRLGCPVLSLFSPEAEEVPG